MNSLDILTKYNEELDLDMVDTAAEFLDHKQLGDELEAWIKAENARQLAKGKCDYCREPGSSRNKIYTILVSNTETIKYCGNCRSEAADDAEIALKW